MTLDIYNPARLTQTFAPKVTFDQLRLVYDPIELAIVYDWLEIPRPEPLEAINLDCEGRELPNEADGEDEPAPIRLRPDLWGNFHECSVSNAVARLALSQIQHRLPQWGCVRDGEVQLGRRYTPRRQSPVQLLPQFLFTINWADSGPGFSWPESYFVTYLPGFDVYVVTASQDSPDVHGYTDEAIGWFPARRTVDRAVGHVILEWWGRQARGWDQHRWAYLFDTGQVDEETAWRWANRIWHPASGEPRG